MNFEDSFRKYDDGTYPKGFWQWLEINQHIFEEFLNLALSTKASGVRRWSSDAICHVLRWQTAVREKGNVQLKINDHATSGLARLAIEIHPELDGFFVTRTSAKKQARKLDGTLYFSEQTTHSNEIV